MKKIIVLALITSFAATGAAMARGTAGGPNGPGGNGGPGANGGGDNGPAPAVVRISRRPTYEPRAPKKVDFCHIGGDVAASDMECGHYSR